MNKTNIETNTMQINLSTDKVDCSTCNHSGLDRKHRWPDGAFAACQDCEGYGDKDILTDDAALCLIELLIPYTKVRLCDSVVEDLEGMRDEILDTQGAVAT